MPIITLSAEKDGIYKDVKVRVTDRFGDTHNSPALNFIADSMRAITTQDEICVRNGGDEFLIIGLGRYNDKEIKQRVNKFNELINDYNEKSPVPFSASIGYCINSWGKPNIFEKTMEQADVNMYLDKRQKKNRR